MNNTIEAEQTSLITTDRRNDIIKDQIKNDVGSFIFYLEELITATGEDKAIDLITAGVEACISKIDLDIKTYNNLILERKVYEKIRKNC